MSVSDPADAPESQAPVTDDASPAEPTETAAADSTGAGWAGALAAVGVLALLSLLALTFTLVRNTRDLRATLDTHATNADRRQQRVQSQLDRLHRRLGDGQRQAQSELTRVGQSVAALAPEEGAPDQLAALETSLKSSLADTRAEVDKLTKGMNALQSGIVDGFKGLADGIVSGQDASRQNEANLLKQSLELAQRLDDQAKAGEKGQALATTRYMALAGAFGQLREPLRDVQARVAALETRLGALTALAIQVKELKASIAALAAQLAELQKQLKPAGETPGSGSGPGGATDPPAGDTDDSASNAPDQSMDRNADRNAATAAHTRSGR